ncbi:MAG: hypothetical protein ACXU8N_03475 [Telluria sp.]
MPEIEVHEHRITKLEQQFDVLLERLNKLEQQVAVIASNYVTKEDLERALHAMTWKIFGAMTILVAAVYWIARNVH